MKIFCSVGRRSQIKKKSHHQLLFIGNWKTMSGLYRSSPEIDNAYLKFLSLSLFSSAVPERLILEILVFFSSLVLLQLPRTLMLLKTFQLLTHTFSWWPVTFLFIHCMLKIFQDSCNVPSSFRFLFVGCLC